MSSLFQTTHNPDVLSCIANLSNDEVFTPPELVNQMLDMLPSELWGDPQATFLDPACKSGVFLREIAKRLIKGLEDEFPDLEERLEHIYKKQLFGIAITELTSLLSRRSLYCSKWPNSVYSIVQFDNPKGNIDYMKLEHSWEGGRCRFCGAAEREYKREEGLEQYAYEFIHLDNPEEVLPVKFDVIIGNPPYQMSFGLDGGNSANAKSIYNLFISQAIKLHPRYLCMITPSRWMTKTAQGIPEGWVDEMLHSNHFRVIHDFENASDCFPGVQIRGGVSYFLWQRDYAGKCDYCFHPDGSAEMVQRVDYLDSRNAGIVIRDPKSYSIVEKIEKVEGSYYVSSETNFSGLVSAKHFFDDSKLLTSNWHGYRDEKSAEFCIKYYLNVDRQRTHRWISEEQLPKNKATKDLHKVYIPAAGGSGNDEYILGRPFYGEPGSVCSQTFLVIGYNPEKHGFDESECQNIISYIKTKFFRYLVSVKKKTQNGPRGVYQFVPLQDFRRPIDDEFLYEKYGLTQDEIDVIERSIKPLDLGGESDG